MLYRFMCWNLCWHVTALFREYLETLGDGTQLKQVSRLVVSLRDFFLSPCCAFSLFSVCHHVKKPLYCTLSCHNILHKHIQPNNHRLNPLKLGDKISHSSFKFMFLGVWSQQHKSLTNTHPFEKGAVTPEKVCRSDRGDQWESALEPLTWHLEHREEKESPYLRRQDSG